MRKVMIHLAAIGLSVMTALAGASPAMGGEVRVESENIVLYGEVNETLAEDFVRRMEIYRRMIFALAGQDNAPPDAERLTIHAFRKGAVLRKFAGRDDIGGVYTDSQEGPIFLTPVMKGRISGAQSNKIALHEYSHHVLHGLVSDAFPRWYDEGFAEYLSTLEIEDDRISIGSPNADSARHYSHAMGWLDPRIVLKSVHRYPRFDGSRRTRSVARNQFYAQSWLYVHMLQSTPELGRRLPEYLAALKRGVPPIRAFEEGFGLSVDEFHAKADAYWKNNAFEVVAFEPQGDFMNVDVSVTPISAAELNRAQVSAQMAFLNDENRKSLAKRTAKAAKDFPNDATVAAARGAILISQERYAEAVEAAQAALKLAPDDVRVHRSLADARYHLLQNGGANADRHGEEARTFSASAEFDAMVSGFERVLAELPKDETAVTHLVSAYAMSDMTITPLVRRTAATLEDEIMKGSLAHALDLAAILHKDGRTNRACRYFDYARISLSEESPDWLGAQTRYVEGKLGPACKADSGG